MPTSALNKIEQSKRASKMSINHHKISETNIKEPFHVDEMGIECHLNFRKPDQIQTRQLIKENQQKAFFGSEEYKRRIKHS